MSEDWDELKKEDAMEELEWVKKRMENWQKTNKEYILNKFAQLYSDAFNEFQTELYFLELEQDYYIASELIETDVKLKHYFIKPKTKTKEEKQK